MKFAFILVEKAHYPVLVLCRVLGVSTSGFYAWMRRPRSRRAAEDARLGAAVAASHARSRRTYGRPRILADLRLLGQNDIGGDDRADTRFRFGFDIADNGLAHLADHLNLAWHHR